MRRDLQVLFKVKASIFFLCACVMFSLSLNSNAHEDNVEGKRYVLDSHALPLGDGKLSAAPKRGYVYSCTTSFRGGGAQHDGNWINGSVWDQSKKIFVQGAVAWPSASFNVNTANGQRNLIGNALPTNHKTGIFPIQQNDPAYQIDRNPNAITAQQVLLTLPLFPVFASEPQCLSMGMIGVFLNGVPLFNALDAAGRDAVAHEVQDSCNGHPMGRGQYHYHGPSSCIAGSDENNKLLGYAMDGFGIYSMFDINGKEITNRDLDECHGRVSPIFWEGRQVDMYHYVITREYPYTVGCFKGNPAHNKTTESQLNRPQQQRNPSENERVARPFQQSGSRPENGPGGRRPPTQAIESCSGSSVGSSCQFVSPRGDTIKGNCRSLNDFLACAPR